MQIPRRIQPASDGLFKGEGVDYVTCRLCRRRFGVLSHAHLVNAHGSRSRDPVGDYKKRYGVTMVRSLQAVRAQRRSLIARYLRTGKRWTRSRAIAEVRRLLRSGTPLNSSEVERRHPALFGRVRSVFGNWARALRACGIDPARVRRHRRWTATSIVQAIRSFPRSGLSYRRACERDQGIVQAAVRFFGGWDEALREAGLDPASIRKRRHWNPDLVLDEIRRSVRGRYRQEVLRSNPDLVAIAVFYFGNWPMALEAAGVVPRILWRPPDWSSGRLLAEMRRSVRDGTSLAWGSLLRTRPDLIAAAIERFGSWCKAVLASGFRVTSSATRQEWTRPELLGFLQRLRQKYGSVSSDDVRSDRPAGYTAPASAVRRMFGSLKRGLAIAEVV